MRRCALAAALGLALVAGLALLAVRLADEERLRTALERLASDASGYAVEFGDVEFSLFPLPAIEVAGLGVAAGPGDSGPPLARVERLRGRVAFWPLLAGELVVRSLHVSGAALDLSALGDASLEPSGSPGAPSEAGAAPPGAEAREAEPGDAPPLRIAVQSLRVEDGSLAWGDWTLRRVRASGGVGLDLAGELDAEMDVSGPVSADGLEARLEFAFDEGALRSAALRFEAGELRAEAGGAAVRGPVSGEAVLGGRWGLDLTRAEVRVPGAVRKAPGLELRLAGALPAEAPSAAPPRALRAELAGHAFDLELDLDRGRFELADADLELDALHPYLDPELPRPGGRVRLRGLGLRLDPREIYGEARLEAVRVPLPGGEAVASGLLRGRGRALEIGLDPLRLPGLEGAVAVSGMLHDREDGFALAGGRLRLAEQEVALEAAWVPAAGVAQVEARTVAASARLGPLLGFFGAGENLDGRLESSARLHLQGGIESLRGRVEFDVRDGRLRGFSLLRQILGRLAELPILVATLRGKDLSKYDDERFERLSGTFDVRGRQLSTRDLTLEYRHATARLHGSVDLEGEGALDLRGRAVLSREVDAELGKTSGGRTTIPIPKIGGSPSRPRVEIDERVLAELALAYAAGDRVRRKLDEKLGPGAGEAVQGLFDLLRGRPER